MLELEYYRHLAISPLIFGWPKWTRVSSTRKTLPHNFSIFAVEFRDQSLFIASTMHLYSNATNTLRFVYNRAKNDE